MPVSQNFTPVLSEKTRSSSYTASSKVRIFHTAESWCQVVSHMSIVPGFEKESSLSTTESILFTISILPAFHPSQMYELFSYTVPRHSLSKFLSRLQKRNLIQKILPLSQDVDIRSGYCLTQQGFEKMRDYLTNYKIKKIPSTSPRHAYHDIGTGYVTLSLLASPLQLTGIDYSYSFPSSKDNMFIKQKKVRYQHPDATYSFYADSLETILYLEHDTGQENISVLAEKLEKYNVKNAISHPLSENAKADQSVLMISFRAPLKTRPACFRLNDVKSLLDAIPDTMSVQEFLVSMDGDKRFDRLYDSFPKHTAAFKKNWGKSELTEYYKKLYDGTEPSVYQHEKRFQRAHMSLRRKRLMSLLFQEYGKFKNGYSTSFEPTFFSIQHGGYCMPFVPANLMNDALPYLFMNRYPETIANLEKTLSKYYGKVSYSGMFEKIKGNSAYRFRNHFIAHDSSMHLFIESGYDMGAVFRARLLIEKAIPESSPVTIIFAVSTIEEAFYIGSQLDPETGYRIPFKSPQLSGHFICFLLRPLNCLFSLQEETGKISIF